MIMPGVTVIGEHRPGFGGDGRRAHRVLPRRGGLAGHAGSPRAALRRTSLHDGVVARPGHRGRRLHRLASHARVARRRAGASPCSTTSRSAAREAVPDGARFVHGDIRDDAAVADALRDVDCVFHLAAQVTIRGSFDRFHEDLDTNVMGTARLLRAVDRERVKWFTLASSMAVYADADSPAPIDESHPKRPLSPYGVGKLAAEDVSSQILDGARHSVHRGAVLQYLRSRADLHAVCRRADDLHHAAAARRVDHHLRRRRAAARLHSRQRHRRRHAWRRPGARRGATTSAPAAARR